MERGRAIRTRSRAAIELNEVRARRKRQRESLERPALVMQQQQDKENVGLSRNAHGVAAVASPSKVTIGASFGGHIPVEQTPVKSDMQSPPHVKRVKLPQAAPTPEKSAPSAVSAKPKKPAPVRSVAQSASSSTRKRMISFSPERADRPTTSAAELRRLERNLKATEKLELRLEGLSVKKDTQVEAMSPAKVQPFGVETVIRASEPQAAATESPQSIDSEECAIPPTQSIVLEARSASSAISTASERKASAASAVLLQTPPSKRALANAFATTLETPSSAIPVIRNQSESPENEVTMAASQTSLSEPQQSEGNDAETNLGQKRPPVMERLDSAIGGDSMASFTSTSVIEDVGLFNCDDDAECTGGVYGEGTDGKVVAAVIRDQKVALKSAKPHEGFPIEEAKRRSAIELHYLRKVRHFPGFVQCLGVCDGIEHTCIALEVMDCKLSDYLRKYGTVEPGSKRKYTLSLDMTKKLLKQICQPMMVLHDQINVAHGDLACRNILMRLPPKGYELKMEPVAKLSDFGRIKTPASEPRMFEDGFSFSKNVDVGAFAREILYRLLVGEIVPPNCVETRSLHKYLQDVVVKDVPEVAREKLGPFYRLFRRCCAWGVRPSFREIYEHLDDLEYFETTENGLFPLKPNGPAVTADPSFMSPVVDRTTKPPSSGSKGNKFETPATAGSRPGSSTNVPRLLQSKSFPVDTPGAKMSASKTVNWLKARSVTTGSYARPVTTGSNSITAGASAAGQTPTTRQPMLLKKKTPPSAGASKRSLQILNRITQRLDSHAK
ncbi:TPA: hypothetical protein N0F65_010660 [Lagenidium giganteum]|uniref:Protein kinase domain-containing protein n=1 Tax=Lagenidium giganteum TaxID=4803 RepID=A0AAV2ZAU9_9STRA|nr:TPA: hypothetical protein N0F65_010660 [Lagenidium giganteum]